MSRSPIDARVGYDFGTLTLEGGYRHMKYDRTFRETESTSENGFVFNADLRPVGWFLLRGVYEHGERDFEGLEIELSEEASFQVAGAPANLLAVPSDTLQTSGDDLRGRQSGGTVSNNPADDWTSNVRDKTNSVGGGAHFTLVPKKWLLDLFGQYQKVDGNNDIGAFPGGAPFTARVAFGGAQGLGLFDDTKITTLTATLRYQFATSWDAGIGGWFEDYTIEDSNTQGVPSYAPGRSSSARTTEATRRSGRISS